MTPAQLEARDKAVSQAMKSLIIPISHIDKTEAILQTLWMEGWLFGVNQANGKEEL